MQAKTKPLPSTIFYSLGYGRILAAKSIRDLDSKLDRYLLGKLDKEAKQRVVNSWIEDLDTIG